MSSRPVSCRWMIREVPQDGKFLTNVRTLHPWREGGESKSQAIGKWYSKDDPRAQQLKWPNGVGYSHFREYRNESALNRAVMRLLVQFPNAKFQVSRLYRQRKTGRNMVEVWNVGG